MVELLLNPDRATFTGEIAETLDVEPQTIRNRAESCISEGWVEVSKVSNRNLYRLTDDGYKHLAEVIRDCVG